MNGDRQIASGEGMEEKKYLIGDREFVLRDNLSFEELEIVEKFTNPFHSLNKGTVVSKKRYSNAEILELVKMILQPIDGNKEDVNWKKLTPEQSVEIIADFLKKKAIENIFINRLSRIYSNGLLMQSEHTIT